MKRKIVLWGSNEKDEKILVALHLLDREGKVNIYTFNEEQATEEFYNNMLNKWREGQEVEFPEGHGTLERPLSLGDALLPEDIKVDRTDIISRAQTEWHFVVLSAKLFEMYRSELDDFQETIENLKEFDNKVWNEMKGFWGKVQEQVIEKNLFREHASTLKTKTNKLFDHLKGLKKKLEEEFEAKSAEHKQTFMTELQEIEEKVEKGLGLKPIFEQLKSMQSKLREFKFTRKDRDEIWGRMDKAFKDVKEKRFGDKGGSNTSATGRLQRRYDGLISAIAKMEKSISRDKDDLAFQDRKIATTNGQLEMQIRQAKIKMIEERVNSKSEKLDDMLKTKVELEQRIQKEKAKEEKRAKMAQAKAEAEAKIAAEVKKSADKLEANADKLEEAASKIAEGKKEKKDIPPVELGVDEPSVPIAETKEENSKEPSESEDTLIGAITSTVSEALGGVGAALGDVVDTVKAVADVVEDKIEDAIESITSDEEE